MIKRYAKKKLQFELWCGTFSWTSRNNCASQSTHQSNLRNHFGKLWIVDLKYKEFEGPPWVSVVSRYVQQTLETMHYSAINLSTHGCFNWLSRKKGPIGSSWDGKGFWGGFLLRLEAHLFKHAQIALSIRWILRRLLFLYLFYLVLLFVLFFIFFLFLFRSLQKPVSSRPHAKQIHARVLSCVNILVRLGWEGWLIFHI